MSRTKRITAQQRSLALALAAGKSVADWCAETATPERTGFLWAASDGVKALVAEIQGRILETAVRKLAAGTTAAAETLIKLLDSADERVKLRAARAVLDNYQTFETHVDLRERVAQLERNANASRPGPEAYGTR